MAAGLTKIKYKVNNALWCCIKYEIKVSYVIVV